MKGWLLESSFSGLAKLQRALQLPVQTAFQGRQTVLNTASRGKHWDGRETSVATASLLSDRFLPKKTSFGRLRSLRRAPRTPEASPGFWVPGGAYQFPHRHQGPSGLLFCGLERLFLLRCP